MNDEALKRLRDDLGLALDRLDEAVARGADDPLVVDGTIQRFEFTFELAWKLIARLLARQGIEVASPCAALRQAHRQGWLDDEGSWLRMLEDRNLTSHAYRESMARAIHGRLGDHALTLRRAFERLPRI